MENRKIEYKNTKDPRSAGPVSITGLFQNLFVMVEQGIVDLHDGAVMGQSVHDNTVPVAAGIEGCEIAPLQQRLRFLQ